MNRDTLQIQFVDVLASGRSADAPFSPNSTFEWALSAVIHNFPSDEQADHVPDLK